MRKRWKIITAILLSAAMTAGSMGTGFAAELSATNVTEGVTDESDEDAEGLSDDEAAPEETINEESEKTEKEPAADEDKESTGSDAGGDQEQDQEETETSENDVQTVQAAPGETTDDTVSDPDVTTDVTGGVDDGEASLVVSLKYTYSKEYDGKVFNPGVYKLAKGKMILSENNSPTTSTRLKQAVDSDVEYTLPGITTVAQSYTYYVFPNTATKSSECTEIIEVNVTKRPITYRSGTYTKEYDGKPLSQNSAAGAELPKVVKGSMVDGQSFAFNFDITAQRTDVGSTKNKFTVSSTNTADTKNYETTYEYGNLIVTASRNNVNSLPAPDKLKAVMDTKGNVKLTWKRVKSFKYNGKKGGKTTYEVWRYREDGTWGDQPIGETKKASFIDKTSGENERFIYKVIAKGIDASGVDGCSETPGYVRATPLITSVVPYDGINFARVTFIGLGTDTDNYTLEHWNQKNKGTRDQITVNKYNSSQEEYKAKSRNVSANSYLDAGGSSVTISGNNKNTFNFRVMASETTVYDYGKPVAVAASAWSKIKKLKLISYAPVLRGERESNTSFELKWNKVAKATGYLVEYSQNKDFSNSKLLYCSKSDRTSIYNNREYEVSDVPFGVPYYCRVTAYLKNKNDGSAYGTALGTSNTIIEYGRQKAVKNLEAEYFEDGNNKADARLTWEDDTENVRGYYVQRWSYEYNPATKKYDKLTGHVVLQDYLSNNDTRKRYASTVGGKINNGELIKYRVQSVIYQGGTLGENYDGYVFSEPSEYYYMNPSEVSFTKKKITVAAGSTYTPTLKFKPKKMPKTADGLSKSEFQKVFCFNDKMEYVLQSDSLTNSEIKKHVTVVTGTGKLTGVSTYNKSYIKLKASSPNDPSTVYAIATVMVGEGESSDSGSGETSGLVVCIDPGHGGKDDGADNSDGDKYPFVKNDSSLKIVEKDMNLKIAKKVGEYLKDGGAKVYYTRTSDEYISLTDRTDYADSKKCNLFISIHCNSSETTGPNGTEVYYSVNSKYAKKGLAESISKAVSGKLRTKNIGAKSKQGSDGDYYSVIRTSAAKGIPGLIVEHAFISNEDDARKLKNDDNIDKMAKAEAKAILNNWE